VNNQEAIERLRELQVSAPVLSPWTVAERATAILDRSTLRPLELEDYLIEHGIKDHALAQAMSRFAMSVRQVYFRTYGVWPIKKDAVVNDVHKRVNAYIEEDRGVFAEAFLETFGEAHTSEVA